MTKICHIIKQVQWNLRKAKTQWTKNVVRFREVSTLESFCFSWPETRKNSTPKTAILLDITIIPFNPV